MILSRTWRAIIIILARLIIPFAFLSLIAGCSLGRQPAPTPFPIAGSDFTAFGPNTVPVRKGEVVASTIVAAKGVLAQEEELFFGVDGRVESVHIRSGMMVSEGDLIAELDTRDFRFDVDLAEIAVQSVEAQIENARRFNAFFFDNATQELRIAELRLAALEADANATPQDIEIQRIRVDQAQAFVDRLEAGLVQGLISGATTDLGRLAIELEQAKINLAKQEARLGDMQVTAPFDGQVRLFDTLEAGQAVLAYEPVGLVVDPNSVMLEVNLVTEELGSLYEGMPVQVRFASRSDELLPARILTLPQPFGAGSGPMTRITLEDAEEQNKLRPGMSVEVIIEKGRAADALWLPPTALRGFTDNYYVEQYIESDNTVRERSVSIGLRNGEQVQILTGVAEGDLVVID